MNFVTSISSSNQNVDQLDQSFMYTQLFKEILLEIKHNQQCINEFVTYCMERYADDHVQLSLIRTFQREYDQESSLHWYSYASFLYTMLNRALRTQEVDIILKMGFFIRDLHKCIEQLHSQQFGNDRGQSLPLFRGQGISKWDFDKMMKAKGGLMAFNNFLSTSSDEAVSLAFAQSNADNLESIGILFEITVDRSIPSTPFADISEVSNCFRK
jgi:hypothetical protein